MVSMVEAYKIIGLRKEKKLPLPIVRTQGDTQRNGWEIGSELT